SYRATRDEQHLTRGRANTLRLALSGQLGPEALTSDEVYRTLELCVSCKGCKRECPTGVDVAKMKVEFLHHYRKRRGLTLKDRLIAYLPRYAPWGARLSWFMNLRDRVPGLAPLSEKALGLSAKRTLPRWRSDPFHKTFASSARSSLPFKGRVGVGMGSDGAAPSREVALFIDTFNNYFEPENAQAAVDVLQAAGYTVHLPRAADGPRPLCCGRTFLASGLVDEAKAEAQRMLSTLLPYIERGVPVVGLEPSCLLGLRDEFISMLPGAEAAELALNAFLFEEFIAREVEAGRFALEFKPLRQSKALLHGHCHQKAFAVMPAVQKALALIPGLTVETVESRCCGMAGGFGFEAGHYDVSMKMGELSLLPAVRKADAESLIVADGTSCRHQIHDGAGREALHVARVLQMALAGSPGILTAVLDNPVGPQ
ncbi:MAG TPA: heterodisulfide reductase-related iron-sulfur binding cluster, partial [Burkholderiales bacterium]|nr:heterodisulfide reductase-related iron-sulfur binding cluster [Burkholderiales bacterium]